MNDKIHQALLFLKNKDWEKAHQIAQSNQGDPNFDLLHAFLHRWEGDIGNAKYWYSICNLKFPETPIIEELNQLMERFKPAGK